MRRTLLVVLLFVVGVAAAFADSSSPSIRLAGSAYETCYYISDSGDPMHLNFDYSSGDVHGRFGRGGAISGYNDGGRTWGNWALGRDGGEFEFNHEPWGFWGYWKYYRDYSWREDWTAELIRCE